MRRPTVLAPERREISTQFDRRLLEHGMVDEYHLWLFPVAVGRGERLFDGFDLTTLRLQDSTTFSTGIVVLVYSP